MTQHNQADTEGQTLALALSGDQAAFRSIYDAQSGYVRDLVHRLSGGRGEADDFVQDIFVAAWRSLPSFRGESQLRTWLHSIAVRVVWAHMRRPGEPLWVELEEALNVTRHTSAIEERMDLERALASLPAGARTILLLHEIDGFRYREIADHLEISIGTVKSQLHRARNLLMEYLS